MPDSFKPASLGGPLDRLRIAVEVAEALRALHEAGRVHGSLSPASIVLSGDSVELRSEAPECAAARDYAAPEVLAGNPPDTRSDIFSLGKLLGEMLPVDRATGDLVRGCTEADPQARLRTAKRVSTELKLLYAAARRAQSIGARARCEAALRAEVAHLKTEVGGSLQDQRKMVAEVRDGVYQALDVVRGQLASAGTAIGASRERVAGVEKKWSKAATRLDSMKQGLAAAGARIDAVERKMAKMADAHLLADLRQALLAATERVARLERALEVVPHGPTVWERHPAAVRPAMPPVSDPRPHQHLAFAVLVCGVALAAICIGGIETPFAGRSYPSFAAAATADDRSVGRLPFAAVKTPGPHPISLAGLTAAADTRNRPSRSINAMVAEIAARESIPTELIHSVIQVESRYDPHIVSPYGAQGLMQITPTIAKRFGVANALNPADNIRGGTKYLRYLVEFYKGDYERALAAYNAGIGAVAKYGGVPPYAETHRYLLQVGQELERQLADHWRPEADPR